MIVKRIYSKEYLDEILLTQKCDPTILERTIFAFGILEALVTVALRKELEDHLYDCQLLSEIRRI